VKTIPIALAPQYSGAGSTLAVCLKVTRADSTVIAVTSHDRDLTVSAVVYNAAHALDISSIVSSGNLSVDNLELKVFPEEGDDQLMLDIQTGLWDGATFELFEVNYLDPTDGIFPIKHGTVGEAQLDLGVYTIEFRSLTQPLQQPVGAVTSKTCRARFADHPSPVPDAVCGLDVADWTEAGTLTGVTSRQVVTDSSRTEDADWFGNGTFRFTTGLNEGRERIVKSYAAGVFTFTRAFDEAIDVGDEYEAVAGCRKRHERTTANPAGVSDCLDKFDNVLNFQAEPHLPGVDAITKPPETDV
jgi:uncharacterized phage protein (TIGR02218 family)